MTSSEFAQNFIANLLSDAFIALVSFLLGLSWHWLRKQRIAGDHNPRPLVRPICANFTWLAARTALGVSLMVLASHLTTGCRDMLGAACWTGKTLLATWAIYIPVLLGVDLLGVRLFSYIHERSFIRSEAEIARPKIALLAFLGRVLVGFLLISSAIGLLQTTPEGGSWLAGVGLVTFVVIDLLAWMRIISVD